MQIADIIDNKSRVKPIKNKRRIKFGRVLLYAILIFTSALMLIPFAWMLSASLKLDKDVFIFPIEWIPEIRDGRTM